MKSHISSLIKSCFILHRVHFCMWNKLIMADYVHHCNGKLQRKYLLYAASTMQSSQHYIIKQKIYILSAGKEICSVLNQKCVVF